jgi:hypothetical protein
MWHRDKPLTAEKTGFDRRRTAFSEVDDALSFLF